MLSLAPATEARPESGGYRLLAHAVAWPTHSGPAQSGPVRPYPLDVSGPVGFPGGGFLVDTPALLAQFASEARTAAGSQPDTGGYGELGLTQALAFVRPRIDFARQALLVLSRGALDGYQARLLSLRTEGSVLQARVGLVDASCPLHSHAGFVVTCAHITLAFPHYLLVRVQRSFLAGVTKLRVQLVSYGGDPGQTASSG